MDDIWTIILCLGVATFAVRLSGALLGQHIPKTGAWARSLSALPGSLIVALVTVSLLSGGPQEWLAGGIALFIAILSNSVPLTMLVGIITVWLLRL